MENLHQLQIRRFVNERYQYLRCEWLIIYHDTLYSHILYQLITKLLKYAAPVSRMSS